MGGLNALEHIKVLNETFPFMYRGVVEEDTHDPEDGRVQVRVYPMMKNEEDIPTEALPWAVPAEMNFSGSTEENQDIGWRAVPDIGSWVYVFFEEGDIYQPVYFASAPAIQNGTPDSPISTREADDTVGDRIGRLSKGVAKARLIGSFDEPDPAYAAEYPRNKVRKTDAGIMEEWDDTPGNRRIHTYHPSGTGWEIDDAGNMTLHVVGNFHQTVEGDFQQHVKGDHCIHTDGAMQVEVDGRFDLHSDEEIKIEADDNMLIKCDGFLAIFALLGLQMESKLQMLIESSLDMQIVTTGGGNQMIKSDAEQTMHATDTQFLQSDALTHINLPGDSDDIVQNINKDLIVFP